MPEIERFDILVIGSGEARKHPMSAEFSFISIASRRPERS